MYQPVVIEFIAATSFCLTLPGITIFFFHGATENPIVHFFNSLNFILVL